MAVTLLHMRTGSEAILLERIKIIIIIIAICYSQGASGLSGFGNLYGPLGGCQARASSVYNGTNNASSMTNSDGYFNISIAQIPGGMLRVFIGPNASSCVDTFTGLRPPFQLSAAAPIDTTSVRVGFVSHTALAYLDLGSATSANASTSNTAGLGAGNVTAVRKTLIDLYSALNISLSSYNLDPISLEPLAQITSPNATTRALGVAQLAAEAQLASLVTLGTALLQSAIPTAAAAANRNSTLLSRMVAAEGMQQLLHLEAQRQQELADASTAAATGVYSGILVENSTEANVTATAGLYLSEVVRIVLNASAARANLSLQSYAVNATADVVAGMAQFAEELKSVALREMVGERLGLNPLNAVITLARLTVVQAEAADQMSTLLGSSRDVLQTYVLDALPDRLSNAAADITAIHTYLGLPAPTAPGPANGVAHIVGPLGECEGQASSIWTPDYETLLTTGTGSLQLNAKGSGFVTVSSSYRYCQDELTGLRLGLTLSNLGPAAAAVSVSPVGMLAQGFYTVAASQGLATPSQEYQQAAFSAMGLNLTAYNALMIQPLSANAILSSAPSPPAPPAPSLSPLSPAKYSPPNNMSARPGYTSSGWPFNLSHPLMPAIMSANTQLVGIMYSARALFARSCGAAYGLESEKKYNTFTDTLVIYALAVQGLDGARLNLSSTNHLNKVFKWLADACYFNSSTEATAAVTTTGSFLSGGGGSAVGTAQSAVAAARSSATSVNTSTGTRRRLVSQQGGQEVAARVTSAAGAGVNRGMRHRRRLHADLLSLGVLGPQGLVAGAPRNRDPAQSEYEENDEGQEAGQEAAEVVGPVGAVAPNVVGRVARRRVLTVYVDDSDFKNVYTKVLQILSGINTKLQEVHNASTIAAASPSAAAATNLTDLVVRTSQLGYVLQNGLYVELDTALARNYSQGLQLVTAVGDIYNRYTGEALQQRMEEANFSKLLVCGGDRTMCGASAPPSPGPANSGGGSKKSNTLLYVVAGVAGGAGVLVVVMAGVLTYRAMRNRQVKRTVVNKFATGDMTNLESRMPPTMHVHTLYGGLGGSGPLITPGMGRSVLGPENCVPMVPAALGSDPRVALDYPIFPYRGSVTNNPMAAAAYNAIHNPGQRNAVSAVIPASAPRQSGLLPTAQTLPASVPSSGLGSAPSPGSGGMQAHSSQQPLQDSQLSQQPYPQQQHPQPPPLAEQLSAAVPSSQSEVSNGAIHYGVPLRTASGGGALAGLKLYTNTALVHADASATFADNGTPVSSAPSAVGGALVHRGTSAAAMSASQLRSAPSAGLLDRRGSRQPLPLAPYTAVNNTAAPTASLSSSMRAIPVNAHFNSSLRPPGAPGASGGPFVPLRRHTNMAQCAGHQREGTASLLDAGGFDLPAGRFHGSGDGAGS